MADVELLPHAVALPTGQTSRATAALLRRLRPWALRVLAAGVIAAAAWLVWRRMATPQRQQPRLQTALVEKGPIAAKVGASGTLSALVTVSVGSQVSGRVESLRADFGSLVHRGQVVATIEPSLLRAMARQARANQGLATANVESARARLTNADRQLERARSLATAGVMSRGDLDTTEAAAGVARADVAAADAALAQSRAAASQAELNLQYATIVSPIDGVVISRNVDVGQTVAATLQAPTIFTIAQDLTRMQIDTSIAEADVGKVVPGMTATFTVDAYPGRVFPGQVRQVRDNATMVQNVVTYDAVIDVDNGERLLKPGMTATVTLVYASERDTVRIPTAALRFKPDATTAAVLPPAPASRGGDERILWLLRSGEVAVAVVRTGISDGTWTAMTSGDVRPGDVAVIEASMPGSAGGR